MFMYSVINRVNNNNRLFRSIDYVVVEGFGYQYRCNCMFDISSFIDNNWSVVCVYIDSWFIGVVCGFNYVWIISCEDQVDVWVVYQCVRQFNRRLIDLVDQIFWSIGSDSSLQNDISRFVGGIFCMWVWGEDNGVMGFQIDQ